MRRIIKALVRFIFVALPLILIAAGAGLVWMARSLPPGSGTMDVASLSDSVSIVRDKNAVPHITGTSLEDVYAGLGFAHAQDRLWQMEVTRLAAQGRLSELFGTPTVDADKWLRSMGFFEAAEASYKQLSEPSKRALAAYTDGINAWMSRDGRTFASRLPPEFVILNHEPEPWQPVHSVAALKMFSISLGKNVQAEVMRLSFARLGLSAAEMDDLLPHVAGDNPPVLPDLTNLLGLESGPIQPTDDDVALNSGQVFDGMPATMGASNNWVIAGDRAKSGKPLLANDPHLSLSAPSLWYLAHLKIDGSSEELNLVGATNPGLPLIFLGRNDHIAWGLTNTASDVQDVFIERVNPQDPSQYQTPDGWKSFGTKQEVVKIRGGEAVTFERRWTRHGPVLPSTYLNIGAYIPPGSVAALQWVALAHDDRTFDSSLAMNQQKTVDAFQSVMADFVSPMQSIVTADTQGNIGLLAPGRVPLRAPQNLVMGRAPVPGWDATYDWNGQIPFEGLPRRINPQIGAIGTANTKIVGPDYPYHLTFDWDEPWRQERIDKLVIDNPQAQTAAMSRDVQGDVYSMAFAAVGPKMLALVEGQSGLDAHALETLKNWDYQMARDSTAPLIFLAWYRESMIGIFHDDLGIAFEPWFRARVTSMLRILDAKAARDWCDDRNTPGVESCADQFAAALNRAIADLEGRYGTDRADWKWGKAHLTSGSHAPFSNVPVLKWFFDVQVESAGGPFTIDRGVSKINNPQTPYINTNGSSFRGIYDFSDLEKSQYIQTTGQSGNPFSKHYRDFAEPWSNVESINIPTVPSAYEGDATGSWQLLAP